MLYIITDLERSNNPWTKDIIACVEREFSRRRIDFAEMADYTVALKKCETPGDALLIPTPATSLISPIVEQCNKRKIPVIAPNMFQDVTRLQCLHCVKGDIFGAISTLFAGLQKIGKRHVALYGINSNSQDDLVLAEAYHTFSSESQNAIYFNEGDTNACFASFYRTAPQFDAVICANDYIAIDLIERMSRTNPSYADDVIIVSFSNTLLSQFYSKPFTSLAPNMHTLGHAVADIYNIVKKDRAFAYNSITIYIDYIIHERGNGIGVFLKDGVQNTWEPKTYSLVPPFDFNKAYDKDIRVTHLLDVELCLNQLTPLQLRILQKMLVCGTNAEIGQALFISEETVRYHIKRILSVFSCKSKTDLRRQLAGLFSPDAAITDAADTDY